MSRHCKSTLLAEEPNVTAYQGTRLLENVFLFNAVPENNKAKL